jgi:hypothetical protein
VFYALGREWLIDPGPHSDEYQGWERRYLCSSSAHNVVEVGGRFGVHPVELVEAARTSDGDRVTVRHKLENAVHTRTLEHRPLRRLRIVDEIEVTDGGVHDVRQLFHVHPDCTVVGHVDGRLELRAPGGDRCLIKQGTEGIWRMARGQREPEPLGWYSPRFMALEPIETWRYEVRSGGSVRFETVIEAFPATDEPVAVPPSRRRRAGKVGPSSGQRRHPEDPAVGVPQLADSRLLPPMSATPRRFKRSVWSHAAIRLCLRAVAVAIQPSRLLG